MHRYARIPINILIPLIIKEYKLIVNIFKEYMHIYTYMHLIFFSFIKKKSTCEVEVLMCVWDWITIKKLNLTVY